MRAFLLAWMAFSVFFAWLISLPLLGVPLAVGAACAASVHPTSFNITA